MKPAYWIVILVLLVAFAIFWFVIHPGSSALSSGTVALTCGNKTVYRYTNPDEAFPEFTRDYDANFKVTSGVLGKLVGDTDNSALALQVKNIAQALIDTLDQQNIFYQTTLKAYFIESNNDPCNDALRDKYLAFVSEMAKNMMNMKGFINEVTTASNIVANTPDTSQKVLVLVDTSKAKVDTTVKDVHGLQGNKLVVMKNYVKLNSAITNLANRYRIKTP
jgi:hypothetical protein